jgi:hypothetical protein
LPLIGKNGTLIVFQGFGFNNNLLIAFDHILIFQNDALVAFDLSLVTNNQLRVLPC